MNISLSDANEEKQQTIGVFGNEDLRETMLQDGESVEDQESSITESVSNGTSSDPDYQPLDNAESDDGDSDTSEDPGQGVVRNETAIGLMMTMMNEPLPSQGTDTPSSLRLIFFYLQQKKKKKKNCTIM